MILESIVLECRDKEQLQEGHLVLRFVKHPAVLGQGGLPVLLIHEGQELPQLGQEFLLVDIGHLRKHVYKSL